MDSEVESEKETPHPCHRGNGRHFSCATVHTEETIVESGMNQRCFPANFQSPAEPATVAGAVLGKKVLCTNLSPAPLPLPQA